MAPRWWRLGLPILSYDESFSWRLTQYPVGDICRRTGADVHPPVYYIVLQGWTWRWGDSPTALRGLSVLCSVLAIGLVYLACKEAVGLFGRKTQGTNLRTQGANAPRSPPESPRAPVDGALFAAVLLATQAAQVTAARNTRMYGLGVLLAALTGWLLLRALRSDARRWPWWAGYGLATALFCATHNYALFTVFGQAVFVAVVACHRACKQGWRAAWSIAGGFAYAGGLALILYSPWIPVLLEQMRNVRQSYWIEEIDPDLLQRSFFRWATGTTYTPDWAGRCWLVIMIVCLAVSAWRGGAGGRFFLAQAAAPWVCSIAFSCLSGRSIFYERYLVFAQVALMAFWGVVWARLTLWPARAMLAVFLLSTSVFGTVQHLEGLPDRPPAILEAAEYLAAQVRPGETIWTASPADVNRWRYYLAQAGAREPSVRCVYSPFGGDGHAVHVAALRAEDVAFGDRRNEPGAGRVWVAGGGAPHAAAQLLAEQRFGEGADAFAVALYQVENKK